MQKMIIVRGIPGSGKSTLARILAKAHGALHVETDMLRFVDGKYHYDPAETQGLRAQCVANTELAITQGESIVVSNLFILLSDLEPYTALAEKYGMKVQIIECHGEFGNIHGVPVDVVDKMREFFEPHNPSERK